MIVAVDGQVYTSEKRLGMSMAILRRSGRICENARAGRSEERKTMA
jgi:hypothetical protein